MHSTINIKSIVFHLSVTQFLIKRKVLSVILLLLINLDTNSIKAQSIRNDSVFLGDRLVGELTLQRSVDTSFTQYNSNIEKFVLINCNLSYYRFYLDVVVSKSQMNSIEYLLDSIFASKSSNSKQFKYQIEKRYKFANKMNIVGSYLSTAGKLKNVKTTISISSIVGASAIAAFTPNYLIGLGVLATGGLISIILEYKSNKLLKEAGDLLMNN